MPRHPIYGCGTDPFLFSIRAIIVSRGLSLARRRGRFGCLGLLVLAFDVFDGRLDVGVAVGGGSRRVGSVRDGGFDVVSHGEEVMQRGE